MINLKRALLLASCASLANAAGYKIPEQSSDAVALSASNIAYSFGPDAAYYNPANMMYFEDSRHYFENSFSYIHLGSSTFNPQFPNAHNYAVSSKNADFLIPTFNFISPEYIQNWRFGLSFAVPSGLDMRWVDKYPASTARLFSLRVFEINPSVAYRVNDKISIGAGARAIYSYGKVDTNPYGMVSNSFLLEANRHIDGNDLSFGWNVAATYRPFSNLIFASTYRSKVNLDLKGDANIVSKTTPNLSALAGFNGFYNGSVDVKIPLPAALNLAMAYKVKDVTFLAALERSFWSELVSFNFNYATRVPSEEVFDHPVEKKWKDSNTYRFGIVWDVNDKLRLMSGFAYDESPSNVNYIGFELPDTRAYIYSLGINYKFRDDLEFAIGYLYQQRKDRHINKEDNVASFNNIVGEMANGDAQILNFGIKYRF